MKLGTTYSHRQIKHFSLNNEEAFDELLKLRFDIVRLCCYWDEIQRVKDKFDWGNITRLLEKCESTKQDVLLTVGMKAPRWPEFYIPIWLKDKNINTIFSEVKLFVDETVNKLKNYFCIKYWQVENEPLDPSGPDKLSIMQEFLEKEIEAIKEIDKERKIVVNVWANEMRWRKTFDKVKNLADVIGFDLYYKIPVISKIYTGPLSSDKYFKDIISKSEKPVWITELQAEPWEKSEEIFRSQNTPSMSPEILRKNFARAAVLKPEAILFWGYEYWYWRKTQGDERYWRTVQEIINTKALVRL